MARVETHYRLEEALPTVRSDRNKLKQILINLIFNAAEAMPEGGRLTLSSAYWHSGQQQGQIELGVEDSGPGIPDEVLQQLYSPVASRKGGTHAGVGLAIVGRLVAELGAVIQCHSTKAGTRFKLLLPVQREPIGTQA
jgi:nitrogen-specific signal transduction histidine kinase